MFLLERLDAPSSVPSGAWEKLGNLEDMLSCGIPNFFTKETFTATRETT